MWAEPVARMAWKHKKGVGRPGWNPSQSLVLNIQVFHQEEEEGPGRVGDSILNEVNPIKWKRRW